MGDNLAGSSLAGNGMTGCGMTGYGMAGGKGEFVEQVWILSTTVTPQPSDRIGIWTEDGIWEDANVWYD